MVNKIPANPDAARISAPSGLESPVSAQPTAAFETLPQEMRQKIAAHLKGRDRLHFALVNKKNLDAVKPQLHSGRLARQAAGITTLIEFRSLLGPLASPNEGRPNTICNLRYDLQPEPLMALAPRILALPLHAQAAAQQSWDVAIEPLRVECQALNAEVARQTKSKDLRSEATQVSDLAHFKELLGSTGEQNGVHTSIRSLRADLRVRPLVALAARIASFRHGEQRVAVADFLTAAAEIPQAYHPGLATLEQEARDPESTVEDLRIAACINAVKSGEPVPDVLAWSGAAGAAITEQLTAIAWAAAIKNGASIDDAAARFGITNPRALSRARMMAGCDDIYCGESFAAVTARYDVTDEGELIGLRAYELEILAARNNAAAGHAGLDDWSESDVSDLMSAALPFLKALVLGGVSIQALASRYGVTDEDDAAELAQTATAAASAEVGNGEPVDSVTARYGITDAEHIAQLRRIAPSSPERSPDAAPAPQRRLKAKL